MGAEAKVETSNRMQPLVSTQDVVKPTALARFARNLAVQDCVVIAYFCALVCAVLIGKGPGYIGSLETVLTDLSIFVLAIVLVRGEILRPESYFAGLVYRAGIFGPAFLSYFQLRWILPSVTQRALDADLYAFDVRVFHYEPSVAWDRFVTPATVEWFAFFYFLYFLIMALHIFPFLLFSEDTAVFRHFAIGTFIVFITAHITYMIVPGFGPYEHLHFNHELVGGRFWQMVVEAVREGGALKDIFPSLHTAAPSYLLFFSLAYRKRAPFRYTWPILAFLVSQIVIATMFLRWHYLVDIVAGLLLALVAVVAGKRLAAWEKDRRTSRSAQTIFGVPPLAFLLKRARG